MNKTKIDILTFQHPIDETKMKDQINEYIEKNKLNCINITFENDEYQKNVYLLYKENKQLLND